MTLYGPNLVTNGTFDDGSDWTTGVGWSISGEKASFSGDPAGNLSQDDLSLIAGTDYFIQFDIEDISGATVVSSLDEQTLTAHTTDGTKTDTITAGSPPVSTIEFSTSATPSSFKIDNVIVKEISSASTIEEAVYDLLRFDSTVSGIVSNRIEPNMIPQDTSFPAVRYTQITGVRDHDLTESVNMVRARFQIDSISTTPASGRILADAVRGVLDNYSGTVGTVVVQCLHIEDEQDYFEESVGVDALRKHGKIQDYIIWYNE